MNLDEYLPIINNTLPLYINENGLITTDDVHHINIYKLSIIHYWKRFNKVIDQQQLWNILASFNVDDNFLFNSDGTPFMPPPGIVYLIQKEQEMNLLNTMFDRKSINNGNSGSGGGLQYQSKSIFNLFNFILFSCCAISIFYTAFSTKEFKSFMEKNKYKTGSNSKSSSGRFKNKLKQLYHSFVTLQQ